MNMQDEMTTEQKYDHYTQDLGWTYIPDPTTWTGGVWTHEEWGFVTQGGGSFPRINEAVEAMERFLKAHAAIVG